LGFRNAGEFLRQMLGGLGVNASTPFIPSEVKGPV
jgi:hypothetical protein